jgi:uncharacterized protein YndB with AHSA1/START domain
MPTSFVTPDHDTVSCEIQIAAPPERVFQALTDPSQLPQWWGQAGTYRVTKMECDLRVKGKWKSTGVSANGETFEVGGEYVEIDPPRLLVYTWAYTWGEAPNTTVRWELLPVDQGTLVKLRQSGFAGNATAANDHAKGWQTVFGWMQAFVERGETVDSRSRR